MKFSAVNMNNVIVTNTNLISTPYRTINYYIYDISSQAGFAIFYEPIMSNYYYDENEGDISGQPWPPYTYTTFVSPYADKMNVADIINLLKVAGLGITYLTNPEIYQRIGN